MAMPDAWRLRDEAHGILRIAERTTDPVIRAALMEAAQRYLQLARNADAADARPGTKPTIG